MLAFFALVIAVGGVAGYVLTEHEHEIHTEMLQSKATRVADVLSIALEQPLWNVDKHAIEALLAALASNPEVAELTVTGTEIGVVTSVRPIAAVDPGDEIVRVKTIFHNASGATPSERLGEIRVVLSTASMKQEIRHAQATIVVAMTLILIGLYALVYVLLTRMVHRPVGEIKATIDAISSGNLDVSCTLTSADELGELATRINMMAQSLRLSTVRLGESESKYRRIFENAIEGMFLIDRNGRLSDVNPAMVRLLGYRSADEFINGDSGAGLRPAFTPWQTRYLFSTAYESGGIVGLEMELWKPDGEPIWVELNACIVANERGESECMEGMLADVTARRRAHESLRRNHAALKQEITERKRAERDLLASEEQLRRLSAHMESIREEERKQLAMTIHDELGQILTALKIDLSLLKDRVDPESVELSAIDQMRGLVDKTLQIGRDIASHLRPAALNFGLASALEWLAAEFSRHGNVPCGFGMSGTAPHLSDAHATAVFRIAQEALTNVARHARATQVELRLVGLGAGLELAIIDNGCGFDPSAVGRSGSYGVLGMRERARLMGAELNIESEEGRGAAVYLALQAKFVSPLPSEHRDLGCVSK
ncbi:PAS domain S-box protein [Burkholderia sp. BCC1988]|uniref:sensor histidine kinase n=1 Tax=Burkholderia sp. BCC1988 TaxID=2817443 RepID=UPI002AB27DA2|nr:PAS domain S-box protein [Burkholderia sp. BCC1988]